MSEASDSTEVVKWEPKGETTLDALLAVADDNDEELKEKGTPWEPGHEIQIVGWGGIYSRDNRRITIVPGIYQSNVAHARNLDVSGNYTLNIDKSLSISINKIGGGGEGDGGADAASEDTGEGAGEEGNEGSGGEEAQAPPSPYDPPSMSAGHDEMTVHGNLDWHVGGGKETKMHGHLVRDWSGGITRFIGMEGIICGGAFAKTFMGLSATMSGLQSGDVYGGCVRTSLTRIYITSMHYRSADAAMWNVGLMVRNAHSVIEPAARSQAQSTPESQNMRKLLAKLTLGACPFFEIGFGLFVGLPTGLVSMVRGLYKKTPKQPPSGPPRIRHRSVGYDMDTIIARLMI